MAKIVPVMIIECPAVGRMLCFSANQLLGLIDLPRTELVLVRGDVRIYPSTRLRASNRALSPAEIQAIYNATK